MPLTNRQADRLFDSILIRLENRLSRKIQANFSKLSRLIRDIVSNGGEFSGNVIILENQRELEEILKEAYQDAIRQGVRFTRRDLDLEEPDEDNFNEILLLLLAWLTFTSSQHAKFLTDTTINIFERVFQEGVSEGKTGVDLDRFVSRKMSKSNRSRVGTISTTESNLALQEGMSKTAEQLEFQLLKSWRSQEDRRVRPTHRRANNRYKSNPIPLNENFEVGSGSGPRPLSPQLPQEEIVACRCYLRHVFANELNNDIN